MHTHSQPNLILYIQNMNPTIQYSPLYLIDGITMSSHYYGQFTLCHCTRISSTVMWHTHRLLILCYTTIKLTNHHFFKKYYGIVIVHTHQCNSNEHTIIQWLWHNRHINTLYNIIGEYMKINLLCNILHPSFTSS